MRLKPFYLFTLLSVFASSVQAQSYEEQYQKCSEPLKGLGTNIDSIYFVRLGERDNCLAGSIAPDFSALSVDGKKIELSKLKGQVVVLNFWFIKCPACIAEMPDLNKLVERYAGKKVSFISFAPEDSISVSNFLREHPFKFTAIAKSDSIRREKFKLFPVWPYTIIIDKDGRISKMGPGSAGKNVFTYYQELIDKLL